MIWEIRGVCVVSEGFTCDLDFLGDLWELGNLGGLGCLGNLCDLGGLWRMVRFVGSAGSM